MLKIKWSILYWISIVNIIGTIIFMHIPNKSNFPKEYIIPLIMSIIIKYSIGDLDKGYQWTYSDIFYWVYILGLSYIIVRLVTSKQYKA
jgi:hypothetical protein